MIFWPKRRLSTSSQTYNALLLNAFIKSFWLQRGLDIQIIEAIGVRFIYLLTSMRSSQSMLDIPLTWSTWSCMRPRTQKLTIEYTEVVTIIDRSPMTLCWIVLWPLVLQYSAQDPGPRVQSHSLRIKTREQVWRRRISLAFINVHIGLSQVSLEKLFVTSLVKYGSWGMVASILLSTNCYIVWYRLTCICLKRHHLNTTNTI